MSIKKFSQFDDDSFDPTEGADDAAAWEEEQVFQDQVKDRDEANDEVREAEKAFEESPFVVSVYDVTRHYGGPEEGGWYYDWYERKESHTAENEEEAKKIQEELSKKYKFDGKELSSVRGQGTYEVLIEDYVGEYETKQRPYYE